MRLEYPAKILLAWGEAISGHQGLRDWLLNNGYPELGVFCHALRLQQDARDWLVKNGHPHLMALIHATEGNKQARASFMLRKATSRPGHGSMNKGSAY